MFDHMKEIITRYVKADYPGCPSHEEWNIGEIIDNTNSESNSLRVMIHEFDPDLYSTMNMIPAKNYSVTINSLNEFMSEGRVVIEGNKLLSYTYSSEEEYRKSLEEKNKDDNNISTPLN